MTEHAPFDLVAYKKSIFHRIQIKYRKLDATGKLNIKFSTCWADRNGTHTVPINKDEVDLFCVYCPDTDECYYLAPYKFGSNIRLRVETPKNGQKKKVRFASDYCRAP